jgi:hypothetical protein
LAGSVVSQQPAQRLLACSLCSSRGRTACSAAHMYPPAPCTHTCCTTISGVPRKTLACVCSIMQWVLHHPQTLHWPQARCRQWQLMTHLQHLCHWLTPHRGSLRIFYLSQKITKLTKVVSQTPRLLTVVTTCHACSGHEAGPQAHQVMSLSKLSSEEMYIWQHMRLVSSSLSGRDLKAQDSGTHRRPTAFVLRQGFCDDLC